MISHRSPRPSRRIRMVPQKLARALSGLDVPSNCCGTKPRAFTLDAADRNGPRRRVSQQTNAIAIVAGCAPRERWPRMLDYILDESRVVVTPTISDNMAAYRKQRMDPAEHMKFDVEQNVVAAQPFFSHILHDAIVRAGRRDLIPARCMKWWPQIERGDTAFEEYWDARTGTGSRCHAWSATPTYDLTTWVLGVRPAAPGYSRAEIAPQFGNAQASRRTRSDPARSRRGEAGSRSRRRGGDSGWRHCSSCDSTTRLSLAASSAPGAIASPVDACPPDSVKNRATLKFHVDAQSISRARSHDRARPSMRPDAGRPGRRRRQGRAAGRIVCAQNRAVLQGRAASRPLAVLVGVQSQQARDHARPRTRRGPRSAASPGRARGFSDRVAQSRLHGGNTISDSPTWRK